jgi:dolichol-phosphate mannosyltransferase
MRVMVVVPTYNELENIQKLIPQLLDLDLGRTTQLSVCVVDDNSPDGTGVFVEQFAKTNERVEVIRRPGKLGLGTAHIVGMRYAMSQGVDGVLTMDADFSHHPRYIPSMIAAFPSADLVIGSRYVPGGDVLYPLSRRMLSRGANAFARITLGLDVKDCTGAFRLYRPRVLQSIDLDHLFSNGYSFLIEMLFGVQQNGWKMSEVPIIFADRIYGSSKISRNEILKAIYTCSRLLARRLMGSQKRSNTATARSK